MALSSGQLLPLRFVKTAVINSKTLGRMQRIPQWSSQTLNGAKSRLYHGSTSVTSGSGELVVVDMRSDTITKPTPAMRKAMAEAEVGDDVFGEDPTVNLLQKRMAEVFGMEAALFVPTGTMGNLIAVLAHCHERGLEVMLGDKSHIYLWEQGGIAQLGGVHPRAIPTLPDGTFNLSNIDSLVRPTNDPHQPLSRLICVENTHNNSGGRVIPLEFLSELRDKADQHNLRVHMDGARIMNAAVALDVPPSKILEHMDSVNMCFSKGLSAPVGSILAGSEQIISRGRRLRKVLGGGWRQAGVLAAAALVGLQDATERLQQDHVHAKLIAEAIKSNSHGVVDVDVKGVHTNMIMIEILKEGLTSVQLCERLKKVTTEEETNTEKKVCVNMLPWEDKLVRCTIHSDLNSTQVELAIQKIEYVLQELGKG